MAITSFLQNYLQNFIRSIGKMNVYGFIGIIYASFTAVFSVLFMPRWGLPGYIIAIVLANVIAAVYTFVAAKLYRYVGISNINWGKCKVLLFYSAPLVVNVLINFMTQFLNRPFMEYYQSLENVGLYSVASKFPTIISIMVPIFCMALQISVMEEFGKESYKRFYNNIFRLTTVILMSGCILFIPLGKYIVRLFAAPEYSAAWIYMPMLLLASVFNYWGYFSGTNFTAIKNSKYFLYSGIITVIVSIVSNFVFVSHYGLWGTCLASLSTSMTFFLSRLLFSWRYVKICRIQNYVYQIIMFTLVTFVCVNFDIDVVSIATGIGAALLLIYMNRDLLPLFLSQIKK